ncbi:MAG: hypothetical protein QXH24_00165 [Candidatus Bathyarchaeia archaeon]
MIKYFIREDEWGKKDYPRRRDNTRSGIKILRSSRRETFISHKSVVKYLVNAFEISRKHGITQLTNESSGS